jgi:alkylation response protein AidB-like acyl-CoA dehydrogenase
MSAHDDLMTRVNALGPTLRARADEMERARRMPADLARQLADTGVYRMLRPADIGGLELPPAQVLQAIEALGTADASAGWCAMIGATSGIYSAYLPADLAREVYGVGDEMLTGGVFAPMGQAVDRGDHYEVNGHWRWASGSWNCQWLNGGCSIVEDGKVRLLPNGTPEVRAMIFPRADVELVDTWHTMGLAGTGSVDMKVTGARVPKSRTVSLMADKPRADGALFVFPVFGLLALGIAAVACGNARGALDEFREFAGGARTGGARRVLAERATVQQAFAQADAQWRSARAVLFDEVEQAWQSARTERRIPLESRARLRLAATHMTRTAAEVCRVAHDHSGGAAVFLDNRQQRRLRDAQTATAHMMIAPPTYELAGRVLLGLPTDDTMV